MSGAGQRLRQLFDEACFGQVFGKRRVGLGKKPGIERFNCAARGLDEYFHGETMLANEVGGWPARRIEQERVAKSLAAPSASVKSD